MSLSRRTRFLSPGVVLALALSAAACATNPVTGKKQLSFMSEDQEIRLGQELDAEVRREMGVYDDSKLQAYVEDVGLRLAKQSQRPNLPWHFTIVDSPAINAFALPGGYIYITRGIMPFLDNEAQLAGVLGHEIGHVTARHAAQQYTRASATSIGMLIGSIFVPGVAPFSDLAQAGLGVAFMKFSRGDELQADALGAEYAAAGGWDPAQVPAFLTTLSRVDELSDHSGTPNWLATHPQPGRMFNYQPWGSYLEFRLGPRVQVAFDSRIELPSADRWSAYHAVITGRWDAERLLDEWRVGHVVASRRGTPALVELLEASGRWRLVFSSGDQRVYLRVAGPGTT